MRLPGTMLRFSNYKKELDLQGSSVQEALEDLVRACPGLKDFLWDRTGKLRATHQLVVNGKVLQREELGVALQPSDTIEILTTISGG